MIISQIRDNWAFFSSLAVALGATFWCGYCRGRVREMLYSKKFNDEQEARFDRYVEGLKDLHKRQVRALETEIARVLTGPEAGDDDRSH